MKKLLKKEKGKMKSVKVWTSLLFTFSLLLFTSAANAADLPEGYTAVEYIVAPPGAYIDTDYTANAQTKVEFDAVIPARWEQNDRFGVLFGSRTMNAWAEKAFALQMCTGNSETLDTVRFVYNGAYRQDGGKPFSFGERVTVTCDGQHVEWTGSKAASVAFTADPLASSKSTLYIFADNSVSDDGAKNPDGMNHSVMRLYSFRITEGETLKRDFVPCIRTADVVAGLYDTVGQKFYENAGTGMIGLPESALPFARELSSGTYEINESFAFVAPKMESALKVADGAIVTLKIAAGVTVELRGGDAFEVWGGGAGIEVPANAKLCVIGEGTLKAFGGKGANGCNGVSAIAASSDESTGNFTSGAGGAGGWGGGGAGAGIGGHGASGGGGGNGGKAVTAYNWSYTDLCGNNGDDGGNGKNGGTCGTVLIEGSVTVVACGGAAGDVGGVGGNPSTWAIEEGSTYYFGANGGGGGGSGAKGEAAQDIGGGGGGGYGGGGGGSGAYYSRSTWSRFYNVPGEGEGGRGAEDGFPPKVYDGTEEGIHGGFGGAAGAAGSRGGCRSLTIAETATVVATDIGCSHCYVVWNSEQDYILWDQDKLYHVVNGVRSELAYSTVDANTSTLGNGWYVVKGTVSRGTITVNGTAHLILWDGCDLKVTGGEHQPGLAVASGNALEIFGIPTGSGSLTAQGGDYGAGIGGGGIGGGGTVTINGGTVTATGGYLSAGIGGGHEGNGGTVTVNGGTVTATGGNGGAGIGGGCYGNGGAVTINGGTVMARGGQNVAGIGGGSGGAAGTLTLGPHVHKVDENHYYEAAKVSFEIPSGLQLVSSWTDGGPLAIIENGASRTAIILPGHCLTLGFKAGDFEYQLVGDAEVSFGPFFGDGVIGASQLPRAVAAKMSVDYALTDGGTAQATDASILYSTGETRTMGEGAWYVVSGMVTTAAIEVRGEANLILVDGATLTVNGGIGVDDGATLNIYGQSAGTGSLIANGSKDCAGIGGRNPDEKTWGGGNCGIITINGGTVTAKGGTDAAGIGSGWYGAGGTVTINGGTVTSTGGEFGAGIGGGWYGAGGTVTINGGVVTATGGDESAGIGGGFRGADGKVTLDLTKVEVVEGAVGNGSSYVKIESMTDVLKTEVETFDSDWYVTVPLNAYVNTHFKPDSNTRVTMDVKVQGASEYWFGCWDANWNDGAFALGNDGGEVYCGYGSGATCGGIKDKGVIPSGRVTVALEKGVVYTNDEVWSAAHQSDATFALTNNLYLFAQNRNGTVGVGGSQGTIICYGCQISTNDANDAAVPVRNFVPARTKDEQQIVGLYDTVTGDFYVPRGGTLTLGHDEVPREMDPIGVCSWSWHEPMTNIIRRMEANGFKGIQLALSPWVWEGEGSAAQKETFGDQEGEEVFNLISNKFAKGELDIHATMICFSNEDYTTEHTISNTCGFYYGLAPSATEEQKELADLTWEIRSNQFAKAVERTRALGVRNITAHIGLSEYDDANMSRLYWACKTCRENGCKLLVETGMYSAERTVAALKRFTELHPDAEIGLNFDTANQVLYGADNPTNAYAVMKGWIEQVHIKDCVETYSARGSWATDVEWGRGDVSRTYDMISVLKADGFTGPMLVEHESGSSDPDVREREILTAVKSIRGESAPVAVGPGEVLGPYLTAEAAAKAVQGAEFTPSAEVAKALGTDDARATYCNMFAFDVVPTSGGQWAVAAFLKPEAWSNLVESAQAATRQIPVADIAALELGVPTNVTVEGCVPGFYYTIYGGSTATNLKAFVSEKSRNVLCEPGKPVKFSGVVKPSDAAGFFSIGVKETPGVQPSDGHRRLPIIVPPVLPQ